MLAKFALVLIGFGLIVHGFTGIDGSILPIGEMVLGAIIGVLGASLKD